MLKLLVVLNILFIANVVNALTQPNILSLSVLNNELHTIEREHHTTIGVYALDTNNGQVIAYHADKRFPFQSTCKFMAVSALLADKKPLLEKNVLVQPQDILFWHPISGKYVNQTVPLQTLAEGAISYSDNTAINLIIHELGGLKSINQFARSIGNASFNMENYEINLNSNPNNDADTSTPKDMALSIQKIMFGKVLSKQNKALLLEWMKNSTTGYNRIRAGVPLGWSVADKTGSGSYGISNDIGIVWSPACKPIVLSIYTVSDNSNAKPNDEVIAKITRALFKEFEQHDACYQATRLN